MRLVCEGLGCEHSLICVYYLYELSTEVRATYVSLHVANALVYKLNQLREEHDDFGKCNLQEILDQSYVNKDVHMIQLRKF